MANPSEIGQIEGIKKPALVTSTVLLNYIKILLL
ncbi:MAG: hypothetical protein RIT07_551, partial [Bacteroidota bacterium]